MTNVHNAGHRAVGRDFCRYTVYDNRTDKAIIYDGTAAECAKAMNRSRASFYCVVDRVRKGKIKRYTVLKRYMDEEEDDGNLR